MTKKHVPIFKQKERERELFASNFSNKVILTDQMSDRSELYYLGAFS